MSLGELVECNETLSQGGGVGNTNTIVVEYLPGMYKTLGAVPRSRERHTDTSSQAGRQAKLF